MSGHRAHPRPQVYVTHYDKWTFKVLNLTPQAHTPQALLDTVKTFTSLFSYHPRTDDVLKFVSIYKSWMGKSSHDDLKELIDSGHIRMAMSALDTAFFGGALFGRPIGPSSSWDNFEPALKELHIEGNIFAIGHKGYAVSPDDTAVGLALPLGNGQVAIYIEAFYRDGSAQTIEDILETAVHEMAHAIFKGFACQCPSCNCSDPTVLGKEGHGRLWVEMAEHMRNTIRSWDEALNDFYDPDEILWHNRELN